MERGSRKDASAGRRLCPSGASSRWGRPLCSRGNCFYARLLRARYQSRARSHRSVIGAQSKLRHRLVAERLAQAVERAIRSRDRALRKVFTAQPAPQGPGLHGHWRRSLFRPPIREIDGSADAVAARKSQLATHLSLSRVMFRAHGAASRGAGYREEAARDNTSPDTECRTLARRGRSGVLFSGLARRRWRRDATDLIAARRLRPELLLLIARDALIGVGDRQQLLAADDVVDRLEGLVAGAFVHFAQDPVGRRRAVGAHHLGGGFEPAFLVAAERRFGLVGRRGEAIGERAGVENGLARAVGAAG